MWVGAIFILLFKLLVLRRHTCCTASLAIPAETVRVFGGWWAVGLYFGWAAGGGGGRVCLRGTANTLDDELSLVYLVCSYTFSFSIRPW